MELLKLCRPNAKGADPWGSRRSPLIRSRFFPLNFEQMLKRQTQVAQEFHIYDDNMLVSTLLYMSDKVADIWGTKAKCIEENKIYIGG